MVLLQEMQEVEALDAQGRHEEAVRLLDTFARNGDVEAKTLLGKRMIVGDRSPQAPREGVGLIVDAAERGGAEALSLLSVFFVLGMYVKQSWRSALNSLRLSAEHGWTPAQAQLKLLATSRKLDEHPPGTSSHWLELARTVDLEYWHSAPPANTLHEDPLIRTYPGLINDQICQWLIHKARGRLSRARIYDSVTRETTISNTRTNSSAVFNLIETDLVILLLQMRMSACTGIPFRHFEAATVLHYDKGEQITGHYDFIDSASPNYEQQIAQSGQRIITFLIYLNDGYQSGETEFVELGMQYSGSKGEGLYFVNALPDGSPDRRTLHAGRPIEQGEKWIVSQFIRSRPTF